MVEFADGSIEELPGPTDSHQSILLFLYRLFEQHVRAAAGVALVAPLRLRIREGRFRERDLMLLLDASDPRRPEITVLTLSQGRYMDRGPFGPGQVAASSVVEGFSVAVSAVFETRTFAPANPSTADSS